MSGEEALKILEKLRSGGRFATRFQEQEWGLYHDKGGFLEWGRETDLSGAGKDREYRRLLTETEAVELLKAQRYETISGKIRQPEAG